MRLILFLNVVFFFNFHYSSPNLITFKDEGVFNQLIRDEVGKPIAQQDSVTRPIDEVILPQRVAVPASPANQDVFPEPAECAPDEEKICKDSGPCLCEKKRKWGKCGPDEVEALDDDLGKVYCIPKPSPSDVRQSKCSPGQVEVVDGESGSVTCVSRREASSGTVSISSTVAALLVTLFISIIIIIH